MEFFLFLILLIILILIISLRNSFTSRIDLLHNKIDALKSEISKLKASSLKDTPASQSEQEEEERRTVEHKPLPVIPVQEKQREPEEIVIQKSELEKIAERISKTQIIQSYKPQEEPKPAKPNFFERNPDLEKFIGENLANKIGIGILVLGIGFFVKYAIDKDWINEIGRVFIGIICGGALLGVAHYLRERFTAFSSVLVGGGIAVLYLTIAIAFHEYQLFTQTAAFIIMVIITAFAVALSIGYNRIELAVLSLLGGFASPFMVSTGEGNYVVLFSYILILDVGMLVLAYYKKWNLVNIIAYIFTILLFGSWLIARFDNTDISMIRGALVFAALFYLVFFAMNIINNLKERTSFKAIEFTLLLSNTFLFYAAGMSILNNVYGEDFRGLFTALIGIFNFIFAYSLYRNSHVDKNLLFLLIGLVLTFISLAAPVQLEGNYITLFWAAETVLLLWLSQKSGIHLMKIASFIIMGLMAISLIIDWKQIYLEEISTSLTIILNKGFITGVVALASVTGTIYLLKKESLEKNESLLIYKGVLMLAAVGILYTTCLLELRHQLFAYNFNYTTATIIIGCYNMAFILSLMLSQEKISLDANFKKAFAFWGIVAMFAYLVFYHRTVIIARDTFLLDNGSLTGFGFHYLLVILLLLITWLSLPKIRSLTEFNKNTMNAYSWFYVFFFVFIASAELDHTILLLAQPSSVSDGMHVLTQNHKIGYPILWGITSFILIAIGLKRKQRNLRIISLTLFLITLIKLFLIDIRGISEGGKIAAFISLGVLLLVVSFMYQRLKKVLLADDIKDSSTPIENNN